MRKRAPPPDTKESDDQRARAEPVHVAMIKRLVGDRRLVASIRRWVPTQDERRDVIQEVAVKSLEDGKLEHADAPNGYFRSSARNAALDRLRKLKVRRDNAHLLVEDEQASSELSPERACERDQEKIILARLVAALPEDQRRALTLVIIEEMSVADTAALMGRKDHKVRRLVAAALLRLETDLLAEGCT